MRYQRTFGLKAEQLDELEVRIEDILPEPWDKGIGRPKSLSLREAIMVSLLYKRQNMVEEVIADLFGVSQATVSDIIADFAPLIAQATEEFRPDTEEAKQVTRGRLALVDGTLWPCWSWDTVSEMWARKYKTTGHGSLIIGDEFGNIIFVSDPAPGCDHDMKKLEGEVKKSSAVPVRSSRTRDFRGLATSRRRRSRRIADSTYVNMNTITRSVQSVLPSSERSRTSRPGRSCSPTTGDHFTRFLIPSTPRSGTISSN